jgi:hypothetical protein
MSAPVSFTPRELSALDTVDDLVKAVSKVKQDISTINRKIVREKARRDRLNRRKDALEVRIRTALAVIDTAKNTARIP